MRFSSQRPTFAGLQPGLQDWFNTEPGRAMLAVERELLQPLLSNSFGYHLLQLGIDPRHCLYEDSRVRRKLRAGPGPGHSELAASCDFDALPFTSDSLDVVIIHHVLEFATNPHAVLREIQRVTLPGGRVFVLGFNPWSLQGVRTLYGRLSGRGIWQNRMLSAHRVSDWMELLGFETEPATYAFHRPPLALSGLPPTAPEASWLRRCPGGAVFLISAVKQVASLTPVKPRWAPAGGLGLSIIRPSIGRHAARNPDSASGGSGPRS